MGPWLIPQDGSSVMIACIALSAQVTGTVLQQTCAQKLTASWDSTCPLRVGTAECEQAFLMCRQKPKEGPQGLRATQTAPCLSAPLPQLLGQLGEAHQES